MSKLTTVRLPVRAYAAVHNALVAKAVKTLWAAANEDGIDLEELIIVRTKNESYEVMIRNSKFIWETIVSHSKQDGQEQIYTRYPHAIDKETINGIVHWCKNDTQYYIDITINALVKEAA